MSSGTYRKQPISNQQKSIENQKSFMLSCYEISLVTSKLSTLIILNKNTTSIFATGFVQ